MYCSSYGISNDRAAAIPPSDAIRKGDAVSNLNEEEEKTG